MKLKIVEKGYENFCGMFGMIEFYKGVSVRDVTPIESNMISAIVRASWVEDGEDIGRAVYTPAMFNAPAEVAPDRSVKEADASEPAVKKSKYSREDLEAIADSKGLNGLREIGKQYGVKSTSITKLIEAILEAQ